MPSDRRYIETVILIVICQSTYICHNVKVKLFARFLLYKKYSMKLIYLIITRISWI